MGRMWPIRTAYTKGKNDLNDWYRCPRCGFLIKKSRTATPDMTYPRVEDAYVPSDTGSPNYLADNSVLIDDKICTLESPEFLGNVCGYLSDGTTEIDVYYTPRVYLPEQGCSFCGQVNLE